MNRVQDTLPPSLILVSALTTTLAAQSNPPGPPVETIWGVPSQDLFGPARVAELTGNKHLDVVTLEGVTPVVNFEAARYDARVDLIGATFDLDVASPAGTTTAKGTVVTVGPAGLAEHVFDEASQAFVRTILATGNWEDAVLVRASPIKPDGKRGVIGVSADRRLVLRRAFNGSNWVDKESILLSDDALAIEPLDWDGDGSGDVAVLMQTHIEVYDSLGFLIANVDPLTATPISGSIAVLEGSGGDSVAWVYRLTSGGDDKLRICSSAGTSGPTDLGDLDAVALTAGDFDADGDDDLFVSHRSARTLLLFDNVPVAGTPTFGTPTILDYGTEGAPPIAPYNTARPALGDLDWDGDIDVWFASADEGRSFWFPGAVVAEGDFKATAVYDPTNSPHSYSGSTGGLSLKYDAPAFIPASATHVRVRLWVAPTVNDLIQGPAVVTDTALPIAWSQNLTLQLPALFDTVPTTEVYHIEVQLVDLNAQGLLRRAWPASIGAVALDVASVTQLVAQPGSGTAFAILGEGGDEGTGFIPKGGVDPQPPAPPAGGE